MKKSSIVFAVLFAFVAILSGCSKDPAKPEIKNFELGHHNDKIAHAGGDLHIEADIVAEGKIDRIIIEIHPEGHHHHDHKSGGQLKHDDEWEVEVVYTKFSGLKNTRFHEHIDVPEHAKAGDYHIHFKVIDQEGNSTTIEDEFEVKHDHHDK